MEACLRRRDLRNRNGRRRVLLPVLMVCLLAGAVISAGSLQDRRATVERLVDDLSSPSRARRMRAELALREMGPDILDLLPPTDQVRDAAARDALRQIRTRLEREAAETSVQGSRVRVTGQLTVAEFAEQLAAQSGNVIDVSTLSEDVLQRHIQTGCDDELFWTCLDATLADAGLAWRYSTESAAVELLAQPDEVAPHAVSIVSGAFRMAAGPASRRRGVVRVPFELTAEPRLRPLFVSIADSDFSATADGRSLPPFSPRAVTELPMARRGPARFAVLFRSEGVTAQSMDVRGRVRVHVAAAPREIRFTGLAQHQPVAQRRGGVTVMLQRVRATDTGEQSRELRVRLAVAYDAGGPEFESHRTWIYHNEVWLEDAQNVRYPVNAGFDVTAQASGGVEVEYRFSDLPRTPLGEWQLVYVAPTLLLDLPVEFSLEGVPFGEG